MKMMENFGIEVIYVCGNYDDFLDSLVFMIFYNVKIVKEYIFEIYGKCYYVIYGDLFDWVIIQMKWLVWLGDVGYIFFLWVNCFYN